MKLCVVLLSTRPRPRPHENVLCINVGVARFVFLVISQRDPDQHCANA